MEIGHLKQQTYPRAVSAAGEGGLRQDYPSSSGQPGVSDPQRIRTRQAPQIPQSRHNLDANSSQQRLAQTAVSQAHAGLAAEADHAQAVLAASLGEKLAVSRQVRHGAPKRGYQPDAMVSATGRRAHASYQLTDRFASPQLVDEIV